MKQNRAFRNPKFGTGLTIIGPGFWKAEGQAYGKAKWPLLKQRPSRASITTASEWTLQILVPVFRPPTPFPSFFALVLHAGRGHCQTAQWN